MTIYSRIKDLSNERNISIRELESQLGFSNGTISKWKDTANSIKLDKVASFFNVTTDYLLGRNDTPKNATKKETVELKNILQNEAGLTYSEESVTPEDRAAIDSMIAAYYWNKGRHRIFDDDQKKE
ncbi:helix-turn-helix domain-containing protein [Latilactobacillus sakei]|uniref:helix-turn-helix domain-containing protein n=1 Tax=Latilactobacillus sakei TaxID=1599 RepID=UPI003B9C7477